MDTANSTGQTAPIAPLDAALQLQPDADGSYRLLTSEIYWNIAGPFGGWLFAAGAKAILQHAQCLGTPVEAHARFLAAPKSGTIRLAVTRQSQGRSVAFWRAEVWQGHKGQPRLCAEISMLLANPRTTIDVVSARVPNAAPPESLRSINTRASRLRWLDLYDVRYAAGKPFSSNPNASLRSLMWVKEQHPRALDWLSLIVLADIVAPRVFLLQQDAEPTSTVAMSVYFMVEQDELRGDVDEWLLLDIDGHAARRGFFDHHVAIWRGTRLLATSTQLAWFSSS